MIKKLCSNAFKGIGVGASMIIPGVSGGTMAIILGIYDELISAISSFFSNVKKNAFTLSTFLLGVALGIFLLAKIVVFVTETYHMPTMYLFLGAITGSIPALLKKAKMNQVEKKQKIYYGAYIIIGMLIVLLISFMPQNLFVFDENKVLQSYLMIVVAGIFCSVALVLPGISGAFMLLMMGMYEVTMQAVEKFDLLYLLPLVLGGAIGIAATTRMIERAMKNHTRVVYLIIIGFLIASMLDILPKAFPVGLDLLLCPVLFAVGLVAILMLSKKER